MIFSMVVQRALTITWRNKMKVSDLNFTVELKSQYALREKFPSNDVVGVALSRPDAKRDVYKLKIAVPEAACKKAQMKPLGYIMVEISDCSRGLKILYEDEQGANFKGYSFKPLGAWKKVEEIKKHQRESKTPYMPATSDLSLPFHLLDTTRSQKFTNKFCNILAIGKHFIVVDISKGVPMFVAKEEAQ